jgi:hypothetical protein
MSDRTTRRSAHRRARCAALVAPCLLAACQTASPRVALDDVRIAPESTTTGSSPAPAPRVSSLPASGRFDREGFYPQAPPDPDAWNFDVALYLWAAGIDGVANAGSAGFPINASFSDILDNLEFAGMLAFVAKKGQWGLRLDGIYMDLEGSTASPGGTITTKLESLIAEADIQFSPNGNPGLDFFAGVRVLGIDTEIDFPLLPTQSGDTTMIDPVIGAAGTWELGDDWKFRLRGDVGGFGASSEFTYQLLSFFRWEFAEAWGLDFGYRVLGYDIKQSSVDLDVQFQGLIVGVDYVF